ncbi:type II secretion system F family protein [Kitasatospora sp. MBT66]|uniref:type II secretion system F family protein n=1 Tax=Kitasatospora sp. MBT66 TaxID=1444769 RepID=UPI00068B0017|nr:type II secretion system F family protein [Kitasatospora sp. MBT66]
MIASAPALVAGAAVGGGLVVAVAGLLPARADLGDVMRRLDAGRVEHLGAPAVAPTGLFDKLGLKLLTQVGEGAVRLPRRELDLIGRSPSHHVGLKIGMALVGLLMPTFVLLGTIVLGTGLPVAVPAIGALALATLFWMLPDIQARQLAAEARSEFRTAIASFLELVSLERAADAGPIEALTRAASVGDGWVFHRLRGALDAAELAGIPPWEGLRQLSEDLGVPELGAPADIMAVAGEEGAAVYSTLQAQAASLRGALLTEAQAEANTASEKMILPVSLLVIIMSSFIAYPMIIKIMSS